MDDKTQILIVDLGSQYTQIIRRSLRYLGFHSRIVGVGDVLDADKKNLKGIILSGGSKSVYDADAPEVPAEILDFGVPVLGICYGMQWMAYMGDKKSVHKVETGSSYGPVSVRVHDSALFENVSKTLEVWASHGDSVAFAPEGFRVIADSNRGELIEGIECAERKLYAVQFHPEVEDTKDENMILDNFVKKICGCEKDYSIKEEIKEIRENTKKALGEGRAIIGVSGGVDSTTLAGILSKPLGGQLKSFLIDTGGLRKGEVEKIKAIAEKAGVDLEVIDEYKEKFVQEIGQTIDAEEKRAKFRAVYGEVFKKVAKDFGATHMIQGTLATDLIESGAGGGSALIKTHHNVGLDLGLVEIMPFADYFKFEVRKLAREFGLEELLSGRQPFPGPGLYLRVVGVPVSQDLLELVREADDEVRQILEHHGLYEKISQTVVALLGVKTVGVKGDAREYGYALCVRTVETTDFMTVRGFYLPASVCEEIVSTLSRHRAVTRVFFDYTPKPPATTEFE